jgi:hypothetical protein
MKHVIAIGLGSVGFGCLLFFSSCARVSIPPFTSIECSADPVGPPVTDSKKIEEVARILRTLSGNWKPVADDSPMKVGVAVVLMHDTRAIAQVVIGEDWLSISHLGDHRIPISRGYEKRITQIERDRLILLSRERPNQASQRNAMAWAICVFESRSSRG